MVHEWRRFVTLGMFIIDEFEFVDPTPEMRARRSSEPQVRSLSSLTVLYAIR